MEERARGKKKHDHRQTSWLGRARTDFSLFHRSRVPALSISSLFYYNFDLCRSKRIDRTRARRSSSLTRWFLLLLLLLLLQRVVAESDDQGAKTGGTWSPASRQAGWRNGTPRAGKKGGQTDRQMDEKEEGSSPLESAADRSQKNEPHQDSVSTTQSDFGHRSLEISVYHHLGGFFPLLPCAFLISLWLCLCYPGVEARAITTLGHI